MEEKKEQLKEVAELIVVRMDKKGALDIIYSDTLVYLLSANPKEEVKKYIVESMESLIDKINQDIETLKAPKE